MKVLFSGAVFHPTGFGKHSRELIRAIKKKHEIQIDDFYIPRKDINVKGFDQLNNSIIKELKDINQTITIINDYPHKWEKGHGRRFAFLIHEGSKLPDIYIQASSQLDGIFVPSQATKNLAKWNGVKVPIYIIPEGVDPDFYYPQNNSKTGDKFKFLFIGSWTGQLIDRKGAGLVIKAFNEEFKKEENVELILKISTFWAPKFDVNQAIQQIIRKEDNRIKFNQDAITPEEIRQLYWDADCFVMPTQGESFGLTICEAIACGVPVIVTNDKNSGHMDYTKDFVTYVNWKELIQGDLRFFHPDNRFPLIDLEDLKKKMREVYENYEEKKKIALKGSEFVRKQFNWDNAVQKIEEVYNAQSNMSELQK